MEQKKTACKLFKRCGGCQLSMSYDEQLVWKQERVQRRFEGLCGEDKIDKILGMENPYNYRNKTTAVVRNIGGRVRSGVFQSSTNTIAVTDDCMLENKEANRISKALTRLMQDFKIQPYNPVTNKGVIKYFLIKVAKATGEAMVCIVTVPTAMPSKQAFAKAICEKLKSVKTVVLNVSRMRDKLMLGDETEILVGNGFITDILCSKKFNISAHSFYQINPAQTEKLYSTAIELAQLKNTDTLLDCYCGIGTIGIIASDKVKRVLGVEINKSAIADAKMNASLNSVANAEFTSGDAGEFMQTLVKKGEKPQVVIIDPARAGCDARFIKCLARLSPERIVYISCNIATQERDVKQLIKQGYVIEKVAPVDMFPHTTHIECIVSMRKEKK